MEKVDKVVAGLVLCSSEDYCCPGCPYEDLMECDDRLMKDALDVINGLRLRCSRLEAERDDLRLDITELNAINGDLSAAVERVAKKLQIARAERDLAREKLTRITGEREAAWVELGEKPMPNDYGENPPDFPKEGM